jgi:hypothetical protein
MAELKRDRVRATRFRGALRKGKTLKPADAAWLEAYETRVTIAQAKSQPPDAPPRLALPAGNADELAPVVRGPQLEIAGAVAVHDTEHITDKIDPASFTWEPTVPPAPEGAEPPPPGAPIPPPPGAPIVDEPAAAAPAGDPAAAQQFAMFVAFMARIGIKSGLELVDGVPIPDDVRAMMADPEQHGELMKLAYNAGHNVAVKYGFKSIPMADEAVVLLAVGGSAAAWLAVQKRKRLAGATAAEKQPGAVAQPKPPKQKAADVPDDISRLFEGQ